MARRDYGTAMQSNGPLFRASGPLSIGHLSVTNRTTIQVRPVIAFDRLQVGGDAIRDQANGALPFAIYDRLEAVKTTKRSARKAKLFLGFRLAFLKISYLFHKTLSALLFGFCRIIGDPEKPRV